MGNLVTHEGLKPDNTKFEAIINMPPPTDIPSLQRLLGMTKYLSQYFPMKSTVTALLRLLLKKGVSWQWTAQQDDTLAQLKSLLGSSPVLAYYWQMLSRSPERYSVYAIQIWLTETESASTARHLTMFKLGDGKRPLQDGATRIFGATSTSSKSPAFSNWTSKASLQARWACCIILRYSVRHSSSSYRKPIALR